MISDFIVYIKEFFLSILIDRNVFFLVCYEDEGGEIHTEEFKVFNDALTYFLDRVALSIELELYYPDLIDNQQRNYNSLLDVWEK